jgi:hypothetical protein
VDPLARIKLVGTAQDDVVTTAQCRQSGVTEGQLKTLCRDRRWLRLNDGVYLIDADHHDGEPPRRSLIRAALLSAGPHAVAVLDTAAEVHNIAGTHKDSTIHVSLPGPLARPRRCTDPNVCLHQLVLRPGDTTVVRGIRVTTAVRTVADLVVRTSRLTAVSVLDSGLNRRILVEDELDLVRGCISGKRGAARARPWIAEADARAESPLETRVRLLASDGGLPPDELQFRVRSRHDEIIAIADFAWLLPGARIVGEADGAEAHDQPTAVFRDRTRQNDIVAAGYWPVRFAWPDTTGPGYVPRAIRDAIIAARNA